MRSSQSKPSHRTSRMMASTYSCSSFSGFVSSKRRLAFPPNSAASPKFRQIDFACPRCRYPLGSGGNRVCTRPPNLLLSRSRTMMSRMKFDCSVGKLAAVAISVLGFDAFMSFAPCQARIEPDLLIMPHWSSKDPFSRTGHLVEGLVRLGFDRQWRATPFIKRAAVHSRVVTEVFQDEVVEGRLHPCAAVSDHLFVVLDGKSK